MEYANSLRHGLKAVAKHYPTGVWLDELHLAWEIVHHQSQLQFQAACMQAGYPDPVALVGSCACCPVTVQPNIPNRPMIRYENPLPKLEGLARQLRADACSRYEHVAVTDLVFELCRHFKVPNLDSFCESTSTIPTLHNVAELNGQISEFAAAFVGAR